MAALGQKQPLSSIQILTSEWLVLGYTGHSPLRLSGDTSGCFRPKAAGRFENIKNVYTGITNDLIFRFLESREFNLNCPGVALVFAYA